MQETRQYILDIIKQRHQVTVDDIVEELQKRRGVITAVTVRHHLKLLQKDALVASLNLKRRNTPGRPQYMYTLTEKAQTYFPNNYERLAAGLLDQLRKTLPTSNVNVILEGVADQLALGAYIPDVPFEERLDLVVVYLNENGYEACWETTADGYVLHTSNCPYHQIAKTDSALCTMDMRLIGQLLNVVPRRVEHINDGDSRCSYFVPTNKVEAVR
jgi:predicted ArsR family transcriptional regulator